MNAAGLADPVERGGESSPRLAPQLARDGTQLGIDAAGFDHRLEQSWIGARDDADDLTRGGIRLLRPEGVEGFDAEGVLLVDEEMHELGLVDELVIERADPHTGHAADLVDARLVPGLCKDPSRGGHDARAIFFPAVCLAGRSFRQTIQCRLAQG